MVEEDSFSYDYYHMKIDNALIMDIYESLFRDSSPVRGRQMYNECLDIMLF